MSETQTYVGNAASFRISDMCCPTCATAIEKAIAKLPGVHSVSVSYFLDLAHVEYDPEIVSLEDIRNTIQKRGFSCIQRK